MLFSPRMAMFDGRGKSKTPSQLKLRMMAMPGKLVKTFRAVASQFIPRSKISLKDFSSLRVRLTAIVFVAIAPALALMFYTDLIWLGLIAGVLAVGAAWASGGMFVLRQINSLLETTRKLSSGDLSTRTQIAREPGELGELARAIDTMTASLERQVAERECAEKTLFDRAHQQTVVAALGQFAQVGDISDLLDQVVLLVSQTIEVEFCEVLELMPDGRKLLLRAGCGWKHDYVGNATVDTDASSTIGYAFVTGEPIIVTDMKDEARFKQSDILTEHGVTSGINVVIAGQPFPFGVIGVHTSRRRAFTEDEVHLLVAVATIISMAVQRRNHEFQLHKLAAFAQVNPNPVLEFSRDGSLTYFNDAATRMNDLLGAQSLHDILPIDTASIVENCLSTGRSKLRIETRRNSRTLSWSFFPVTAGLVVQCYVEDITERLELEAQLRQSQKMESIGQLAAGVAHDFNNMLTVIQCHAGIILGKASAAGLSDSAQAIYFASERAASLTRQLLMFSRKNVMQRSFLDLKETVATMTKMLERLLGETVSLQVLHPDNLPAIHADPGMIEQVIMNLSVNARDAMARGGTLTISTSRIEIDNHLNNIHPESRPGSFVCLRVTDTGTGMDRATLNKIFEPFFTTKEVGKGTGLGLATVYGIVKQHEGWIEVASQPGQGTTFNVFFPAMKSEPKSPAAPAAESDNEVPTGSETILVVEDEPVLREMAHIILQECGYTILEAATGNEALAVWEKHRNDIDLVLTDMVMPEGMTGKELAEKLTAMKPGLKVIFTSGYSVEDFSNDASHFLQKPYNRLSIAKKVRDCLDN